MTPARTIYADVVLFPAAAIFAIAAIPLWLAMLHGSIAVPAGRWHAHEMLFGYVLLVLAGYLVVRASRTVVASLLTLWFSARIVPLVWHEPTHFAALLDLAFALTVAILTAQPFFKAAKKAQNKVFGPLLVAFFLCDLAYQTGLLLQNVQLQLRALSIAVDSFVFLILLMGGRIIPALVAGYLHSKGESLEARVQPVLEKTVIAVMIAMIVCDVFAATRVLAGALAITAALVTAIRFTRWRLWRVLDQPQLWALGLGYAWLVPGLALTGWFQLFDYAPPSAVLHVVTIGAIGIPTLTMMARKRLQREPRALTRFGDIGLAAVLLSAAAILRLATGVASAEAWLPLMDASGVAWVLAFGLLLRRLLRG